MKYYSFLPGFIIVALLIVLLTVQTFFKVDIPVMKNIKHPARLLFIMGFMLCAFGTTGHSVLHLFKTGINLYTILLIATGLIITVFAVLRLMMKVPVFGISTMPQTFIVLSSLIVIKIILATIRMMTFASTVR